MITKQHSSIYFLALSHKRSNESEESMYAELHKNLPWVLLPDAIRAYIGPRQAGHFEQLPDGTDVSWMRYPSPEVLKNLTKETAANEVEFYVAEGYPKCVIGEQTDIDAFDKKNWNHRYYHELRIHMLQDMVLDDLLRMRIIHPDLRFNDQFKVWHNPKLVLTGQELRQQVAKFEEYGFIRLVGTVYERTGTLLNRQWFDEHVLKALLDVYPEDLARKTYKFMDISDEVNEKINNLDFSIDESLKAELTMVDDLDDVLDELHAGAYVLTCHMI